LIGLVGVGLVGSSSTAWGTTLYSDYMNRATFDAAANGWTVQTYDKANSKGVYGRIPGAVDANSAFRYGVQAYSSTNIKETNTVVTNPSSFTPPTTGHYLDFSAAIKVNWSSANQAGLVFGMSAYGSNAAGQEDAANIEFVTEQINAVNTNGVAYDRVDLTSFDDYSGSASDKWYQEVESGVNSTDGYHTYSIRLYPDQVDYSVDGSVIASSTSVVPTGTNLKFVLVAWAPDASWPSAEATLPATGFWYMDVSWVTVTSGTGTPSMLMAVPEPTGLGAAAVGLGALLRRRRRK
jgi:MYXO-CTERM domain-containing protein